MRGLDEIPVHSFINKKIPQGNVKTKSLQKGDKNLRNFHCIFSCTFGIYLFMSKI